MCSNCSGPDSVDLTQDEEGQYIEINSAVNITVGIH